jgi:PAS domain S-box-containing protein
MAAGTNPPERDPAEPPLIAALYLLDRSGRVTGWNEAAERESGGAPDELRGVALDKIFAPEPGQPRIAACLRTAGRQGRCGSRGWFTRQDGSRAAVNLVAERIRVPAGEPDRFAVSFADGATGQRGGDALAVSERQFRMLVQGVADYAIYMLDPEGRITNWNLGGKRIKGYRAKEVIGRHFSMFYTPEDRAAGMPAQALETAEREGRYENEAWRMRKDGTRFWAGVVIDRILDADGKLIGFAKITRDMTEKKRAQEELEQARAALAQSQKMEAVGQLTGGVAHDFNNLLTVITNGLDLLSGPLRDEAQKRRIIDSAQRAAERGAKLTQQLLAFSRRQPLRPEIHNINRLIGGFEAVLRRACPEPIEFEMSLSSRALAANIDAPQFETALLNLVVNARDAMPRGGTLRISTGVERIEAARAKLMGDIPPGEYVKIAIADVGEGMAPEVQARVFEPFFTTKEVGKGSGLGLSQVYGFVAQSGGHVGIDSTLGAGTTVTLYLPAAARPSAEVEAAEAEGEATAPGPGRILVVEDDPDVLDVTVETLRTMGYEVLTAPDGPSALAVLRRERDIDVLFTDVVMPRGMNGLELARQAARLRPEMRVLLASGYSMAALSSEHGLAGQNEFAFLAKPYRGSELANKLRELEAP